MKIGILKEIKATEQRIVLVPEDAKKLINANHQVLLETGAGEYAGFQDSEYEKIGAEIFPTSEKIFSNAEFIAKVQPPMPIEVDLFRENQICVSFLMAPMTPDKSLSLLNQKATFFAMELLGENHAVLNAMNEISANMAFTQAGKFLEWQYGGKGIYLGKIRGITPPKILVVGAGNLGTMIIDKALTLGLEVHVTDPVNDNLERLKHKYNDNSIHFCNFSIKKISSHLKKIDVLFLTHIVPGNKSEILFTRQEINNMEKGSVIVDLSIDHGGNLETSRATTPDEPIYKQDDLIYYCVPNMPSSLPHTASQILSKIVLPYIKEIADLGVKEAITVNKNTQSGLVFHRGKIVHDMIAQSLGQESFDINELFDLNI